MGKSTPHILDPSVPPRNSGPGIDEPWVPPSLDQVERRARYDWWFLVTALCAMAGGLAGVLLLQAPGRGWPWPRSEQILLLGALVLILLTVLHSYGQQKTLTGMRQALQRSEAARTEEIQEHYNRLIGLYDVGTGFIEKHAPLVHYGRIVRTCYDTFDCNRVSLLLLDETTGELQVCATVGSPDPSLITGHRQPPGAGLAGRAFLEGRPLLIGPDTPIPVSPEPRKQVQRPRFAMVAPIAVHGRPMGVLCLSAISEDTTYSDQDLRELQLFASNLGVYLKLLERRGETP